MYLSPTPDAISELSMRSISGPVTMLNLLRFRYIADYTDFPELAPSDPISGREAYGIYSAHTLPLLAEVGGKPVFVGEGGMLLIGPPDTTWDRVLLVEYPNLAAFLSMTRNSEYLAGAGHRTAALADSRLLPIE